ncbi:MAG TPA: DUF2807 domain-containing protein [Polyangiaceae bacterium]|jgi:hypothetical protein|nr:DUF2807 domain-containing protein [Polyangiaceae bacterium]
MNGFCRAALVCGVFAFAGCAGVEGNGHSVVDDRTTGTFDAIEADTTIDVEVSFGETASVTVTTDGNLLTDVTTEVVSGTLRVHDTVAISPRTTSLVRIVVPTLHAADADGSGAVTVTGFSEPAFHLGNHGSGRVTASLQASAFDVALDGSGGTTLAGDTDAVTIAQHGSGSLDASALVARGAIIELDGSGSATLSSTGATTLTTAGSGSIHAELDEGTAKLACAGSGSIRWRGNAKVVAQETTGSGSIVHE